MLQRHFHEDRAPRNLTFKKFLETLQGLTDKQLGRDGMDGTFTKRTLLVAGMHFQDAYHYDIEHVRRGVIHYETPDGKRYFLHLQLGAVLSRKDRAAVLDSVGPEDAAA
jgi:uncharacterized radical SAM superfamily Fe-S cluster-containing enzyme